MTLTPRKSSRLRCCRVLRTLKKTTRLAPLAAQQELDLLDLAQADQVTAVRAPAFSARSGRRVAAPAVRQSACSSPMQAAISASFCWTENQPQVMAFSTKHFFMYLTMASVSSAANHLMSFSWRNQESCLLANCRECRWISSLACGQVRFAAQVGHDLLVAERAERRAGRRVAAPAAP